MHKALHGARKCASLSDSSLLGGYASVMLWVIISDAFSVGGLVGSVLFYRLWLASAGQWKMASPAPQNHFKLCSGHPILCVCVFVRKLCISIPYLSLVMSRELWQRPTVAFCLYSRTVMRNNMFPEQHSVLTH